MTTTSMNQPKRDRVVVGIDNGLKGGIVALHPVSGILARAPLPLLKYDDKDEVDSQAIIGWAKFWGGDDAIVCIEEPLRHTQSSQAMRSLALNFGRLYGASLMADLQTCRISVKQWQDFMLGKKIPAGKTKEFALRKAKELWPEESWLANRRCRTPHDGMIDAALIARYFIDRHTAP